MKLSDYIAEFIYNLGVRHIFMLPGGGAMHLNDSIGRRSGLEYICNLHEQGSAIAAEAYGQYSGLGVAMVTTGPGGTNALTGVAGAWLESTPLLVISGQVKRADLVGIRGVRQIGFQEIDIVKVVSPITKYAVTVTDPLDIRRCMEEAVWRATHDRPGPVWVDIPLDVQAADITPELLAGFASPATIDRTGEIAQAVARTVQLLRGARRPVVLAGNGVRHARAVQDFIRWAERIEIPVLTTWKALDFVPDDWSLYVGRPGAVGQRAANFAQQTCDLFISIGARLDFGQTAYNHAHFAPGAKRIVVDIDSAELAKLQMSLEVSLAADAGEFLRSLSSACEAVDFPSWARWIERCQGWKIKYPIVLPEYYAAAEGVNNYVLVDTLGKLLGSGDLLVPGSSGACSEITCQALPTPKGLRFINTQGLGSMGFGVPAALGACLASGQRRTICVDGDGGFPMNAQELAIIARKKLPIKFLILNNSGYGSIRTTQSNYFQGRFVACDERSGLYLPSVADIASAFRIPFRRIESQVSLAERLSDALSLDGPVIVDVVMAPGQVTQPKVSSRQQADGKMVTMPMEDLWPFLERSELHAIMSTGNECDD